MPAFLLFLFITLLVTAAGRQILLWLRLPPDAPRLERNLFAFALGLGLLAYAMLAFGLLEQLRLTPVLSLLGTLCIISARQWPLIAVDIRDGVRHLPLRFPQNWGLGGLFLCFALVSLFGVYAPPTTLEWDSLAYHLADPKLYIAAHRIYYLPWESHSNFAFTAEMWYTLGLLLNGVPLAKWFHFACAIGTSAAIYAIARRHFTPRIGVGAALLFASTPLVFWEAGTAYADLATTFFATLTLLALANALTLPDRPAWRAIAAVLMGLTLSTKATALSTLGLFALAGFYAQWRSAGWGRALRTTAAWTLAALLVGSPWYIKSAAYTGNPVYPFYFHLFGGRFWNSENAAAYDQSNAAFGMGHAPADALLAPWNLTLALLPGHASRVPLPFNNFATPLMTLGPVFLAALFLPAFLRPVPRAVKGLALYALGASAFWFVTAQHVRYLLPVLPGLCLLAAWVLVQTVEHRWLSGYALAALTAVSLAFSVGVGTQIIRAEAPVVLGHITPDAYLSRTVPDYPAMRFINTRLPPDATIVFYGNPFGFYCQKAYFWGDAGHSAFIPYTKMHSADDLRQWYAAHGVTHVLVNTNPQYFSFGPGQNWPGWVYALTAAQGPPLFSEHGVQVYALPPAK